jgi:four helix bundle protein
MDGYRSLAAWRTAQELCIRVLDATDGRLDRRAWAVVDQLRRAVLSVDINIVEGYALGTPALFRRHLRIALGSAAEVHRLLEIAKARGYLPQATVSPLLDLADRTTAMLYRMVRSARLPFNPGAC